MSHFTTVKTKIKDLSLLKKALERVAKEHGWSIVASDQGSTVRGYQGRTLKSPIVVSVPNSEYDIGLEKNQDGTYGLVADWWGVNHSRKWNEQNFSQLVEKEYAAQVVVDRAESEGYTVDSWSYNPKGEIEIEVSRYVTVGVGGPMY